MPINLQSTKIKNISLGNVDIKRISLGGVEVYSAIPNEISFADTSLWEYGGFNSAGGYNNTTAQHRTIDFTLTYTSNMTLLKSLATTGNIYVRFWNDNNEYLGSLLNPTTFNIPNGATKFKVNIVNGDINQVVSTNIRIKFNK